VSNNKFLSDLAKQTEVFNKTMRETEDPIKANGITIFKPFLTQREQAIRSNGYQLGAMWGKAIGDQEITMHKQSLNMAVYSSLLSLLEWAKEQRITWGKRYREESKRTFTVESGLSTRDEGIGFVTALTHVETELLKRIDELKKAGCA